MINNDFFNSLLFCYFHLTSLLTFLSTFFFLLEVVRFNSTIPQLSSSLFHQSTFSSNSLILASDSLFLFFITELSHSLISFVLLDVSCILPLFVQTWPFSLSFSISSIPFSIHTASSLSWTVKQIQKDGNEVCHPSARSMPTADANSIGRFRSKRLLCNLISRPSILRSVATLETLLVEHPPPSSNLLTWNRAIRQPTGRKIRRTRNAWCTLLYLKFLHVSRFLHGLVEYKSGNGYDISFHGDMRWVRVLRTCYYLSFWNMLF